MDTACRTIQRPRTKRSPRVGPQNAPTTDLSVCPEDAADSRPNQGTHALTHTNMRIRVEAIMHARRHNPGAGTNKTADTDTFPTDAHAHSSPSLRYKTSSRWNTRQSSRSTRELSCSTREHAHAHALAHACTHTRLLMIFLQLVGIGGGAFGRKQKSCIARNNT